MNADARLENVRLPIDITLNEKHQQILIALHHMGEIQVNELKILSYLLSSSEYDYVKLLKRIIDDVTWAYGVVDPIEVILNFKELFHFFREFRELSDFRKLSDIKKLSAGNFNQLPKIDGEIQYLIGTGLIIKSNRFNKTIEYDGKTKKIICLTGGYLGGSSVGMHSREIVGAKTKKFPTDLIKLTDEGKRVAQRLVEDRRIIFRPLRSKRTKIFFACAFGHNEIYDLYTNQIEPSCKTFGYSPFRVDLNEPGQTITESILQGIVEAECVIADLTFARPSVYFEVGLAHGLGIPLVLTCRKDHLNGTEDDKKVHFDLAQYKISYWSVTEQGEFEWEEGMSPAERLELVLKGAK